MEQNTMSTEVVAADPAATETEDFAALLDDSSSDDGSESSLSEDSSSTSLEGTPAPVAPDNGSGGEASSAVPPVAEPAPPVPPTPPEAVPVASSPTQPSAAPAEMTAQDLGQMRENLVAEIASKYAMPEEVKEKFLMNPEQVLPTMAARLYVDVYEAVLQTVQAQIPSFMNVREQQVRMSQQAESSFFQRWPALKDPKYANDIVAMGRAYRQQNPQASFEQAVEAVGAMVSVAKGVPLPSQAQPSQSPQIRPPVPVGPGASRASVPMSQPQKNFWEETFSE